MTASFAAESSGSLTNSAATIAANPQRQGLIIGNPSDTVMTFRIGGGTATAAIGIPVPAGQAVSLFGDYCPSGAVSIFCAGPAKTYTAYEFVR